MRAWPLWWLLACCTPQAGPSSDDTGGGDTDSADTSETGETGDTGDTADTGSSDTGATDTGATDTGSADTGATDTGALDCQSLPPAVRVGVGQTTFAPLVDDGEVILVKGPQGGYHIEGAVQVCHVPLPVLMIYQVRHEESWVDLTGDLHYLVSDVDPTDPCCGVRTNAFGYVDTSDLPGGDTGTPETLLDGEWVLVTWTIDSTTWTGSDTRRAQVVWP